MIEVNRSHMKCHIVVISRHMSKSCEIFHNLNGRPLPALDITKEAKGMAAFIVFLSKALIVSASRSSAMKFFGGSLSSFSWMPEST